MIIQSGRLFSCYVPPCSWGTEGDIFGCRGRVNVPHGTHHLPRTSILSQAPHATLGTQRTRRKANPQASQPPNRPARHSSPSANKHIWPHSVHISSPAARPPQQTVYPNNKYIWYSSSQISSPAAITRLQQQIYMAVFSSYLVVSSSHQYIIHMSSTAANSYI